MKPIIEILQKELQMQMEDGIMKAVQEVGITVDKERLETALYDARAFYDEGYRDGKAKWIPSTERLPEHNKKVLCRGIDGSCSVMLYNHFESGWKTGIFSTNLYCRGLITHWMPLPEPPEV